MDQTSTFTALSKGNILEQIVGLHNHSFYSALDGYCSPEEMALRANALGMPALSLTDHGTLSGHRHFQRACKEQSIKPILGEELYFSETDRWDRRNKESRQDGTSIYVHLIALAMNDKGLKNLQALDREAWLSYYYKPRIDWELLEQYNEDIIFTSACMGGLLGKAIEREDYDYAHDQAKRFKDLLGDRYYIEIQSHNSAELNDALLELADYLKIKPVLAEDSHYADPSQKEMEEIFLVLSTHPKADRSADIIKAQSMPMLERLNYLYPDRKMSFEHINLSIAGREARQLELDKQGIVRQDIYENTLEIADRIGTYRYLENETTLPSTFEDSNATLKEKVYAGLQKLGKDEEEYLNRAKHELEVITSKQFSDYFLIVESGWTWAKKQGIRGGVRGSANGSLVCYALGISDIDPLEHSLLFERFLDYERGDWPDVDCDIQDNRRDEVKKYFADKYGHAANITNINRYKGKKALKDAARVIGVPYAEANKVMKILVGIDEVSGHDVIREFKDNKASAEFRNKYPDVVSIAENLFDRVNGYGIHASGFIVSNVPIAEYAPIETRPVPDDKRVEVVGLDFRECEKIGLIKIDLLGLSTYTVIDDAIKLIKENQGILVDISKIPFDDRNVYAMLSEGKTLGVFQCETAPSTKLLMKMGCSDFADLVVSNALVRPGAWNAIGEDYIKAKKGKSKGLIIHDDVASFMDVTFGYSIFQEQMMQLSTKLAGFTVGEANGLRKGIGKKIPEIIAKYKTMFINGASKKIDKALAEKLWISFEESGYYAFNRSHATSYALVSYQTAWLKYHYPLEFMCAVLKNETNSESVTDYLLECKNMGIKIKLPHINHSDMHFKIEGDSLRMGLAGVKYISDKIAGRIISMRPYTCYTGFRDYVLRKGSGLNARVLSSLDAFGGAAFEDNPAPENYKSKLYEFLGIPSFDTNLITQRMKDNLRPLEEYTDDETFISLAMVKTVKRGTGWARIDMVDSTGNAGVFTNEDTTIVKGKMYLFLIGNNRIIKEIDLEDITEKDEVIMDFLRRPILEEIVPGQFKVLAAQARKTKKNTNMAYITVCDEEKNINTLMVFDGQFNLVRRLCKIGSVRAIDMGKTRDGSLYVKGVH